MHPTILIELSRGTGWDGNVRFRAHSLPFLDLYSKEHVKRIILPSVVSVLISTPLYPGFTVYLTNLGFHTHESESSILRSLSPS